MISKNVLVSSALYAANAILGLVLSVVLARFLGVNGFGVYSYYLAIATMIAVPVQAGMPTLLLREVARAKALSEPGRIRSAIRIATLTVAVFSVTILAAVVLYSLGESREFFDRWMLLITLLLVPLLAFGAIRGAAIRALGRVLVGQLPEMVLKPILLISIFVAAFAMGAAATPVFALSANLLSSFLVFVLGTAILRKILRGEAPAHAGSAGPSYSWTSWMVALIPFTLLAGSNVVNRQVGVVVLGSHGDAEQTGIYRIAVQFADILNLSIVAVGAVVGPRIAALHAKSDAGGLQKVVRRAAIEIVALSSPAAIFLCAFGQVLIAALYGAEFLAAYPLLLILAIGQAFSLMAGPVGLVMNMSHQQGQVAAVIALGAAVNLVICLVFAPLYGAMAAAVGSAISILLINVILSYSALKTMHVNTTIFGRLDAQNASN